MGEVNIETDTKFHAYLFTSFGAVKDRHTGTLTMHSCY